MVFGIRICSFLNLNIFGIQYLVYFQIPNIFGIRSKFGIRPNTGPHLQTLGVIPHQLPGVQEVVGHVEPQVVQHLEVAVSEGVVGDVRQPLESEHTGDAGASAKLEDRATSTTKI